MQEIIEKAREFAISEIKKYNSPLLLLFQISELKALEFADKLKADKEITHLGVILMDIGLGVAKAQGKREQHIQIGAEMVKEFLDRFNIEEEKKKKVLNCVVAHHGTVPYDCLEAEICANADCYRFIPPQSVFIFLHNLGRKKDRDFFSALEFVEEKMDEKWNTLSIDFCKKELEPYYKKFKEYFAVAKIRLGESIEI